MVNIALHPLSISDLICAEPIHQNCYRREQRLAHLHHSYPRMFRGWRDHLIQPDREMFTLLLWFCHTALKVREFYRVILSLAREEMSDACGLNRSVNPRSCSSTAAAIWKETLSLRLLTRNYKDRLIAKYSRDQGKTYHQSRYDLLQWHAAIWLIV